MLIDPPSNLTRSTARDTWCPSSKDASLPDLLLGTQDVELSQMLEAVTGSTSGLLVHQTYLPRARPACSTSAQQRASSLQKSEAAPVHVTDSRTSNGGRQEHVPPATQSTPSAQTTQAP